jgi:hypothetical protein
MFESVQGVEMDRNEDDETAVKLYLKLSHAQSDYDSVCEVLISRPGFKDFPTHHPAKKAVENLSGVTGLMIDMCVNSCHAFTGPFSDHTHCYHCTKHRYDQQILQKSNGKKKVPRQQYPTLLLGPQLQATYRDLKGATAM